MKRSKRLPAVLQRLRAGKLQRVFTDGINGFVQMSLFLAMFILLILLAWGAGELVF